MTLEQILRVKTDWRGVEAMPDFRVAAQERDGGTRFILRTQGRDFIVRGNKLEQLP